MKHLNIYLDQNIYGHLLTASTWRDHPIAKILTEAKCAGRAYVWISPIHVVELIQSMDLTRRRAQACIMLELSDARRMLWPTELMLIESFGNFLNHVVAGVYNSKPYIEVYKDQMPRQWLGNLALLGLECDVELGPSVNDIRKAKLETRLLHARMAANPDKILAQIIQCAANYSVTVDEDPVGLSNRDEQSLRQELEDLTASVQQPSKQTIRKIQQYRREIAQTYGAIDIGGALQSIFGQFPLDLEFTFDTPKIIKHWSEFQTKYHVSTLPKKITEIGAEQQALSREIAVSVLNACIRAAANARLSVATVGYYSILRELEVCLNQNRLPSMGATLDVDHATAAFHCDIFVCHDRLLAEHLKSYVTNIGRPVAVVTDHKQLQKALR